MAGSSRPKSPFPFRIYAGEAPLHFVAEADVFVVGFAAAGGRGVGFFVPHASLAEAAFVSAFRSAATRLGVRAEAAVWKAIGAPAAVERAAARLREAGAGRIETKAREFPGAWEILFEPGAARVRVAAAAADVAPRPVRAPEPERKTRVLVVDDSKTIRGLLTKILGQDPQIEIVGAADRPSAARELIRTAKPDVITLDIHMPEMDGVEFLREYLPKHPVPTVMISSISLEEGPRVLQALETGAVDYIQKPSFDQIAEVAPLIVEKVKAARYARVRRPGTSPARAGDAVPLAFDRERPPLVAIGSSTGGTEALRCVFERLPAEIPPIVVVQHIPPVFSRAFAERMNALFPFEVVEGEDGMEVRANRIIIAPGATQMSVVRDGALHRVRVDPRAAPVNRHKPSVDVLFRSVAPLFGARAIGIILTGMGGDGAEGLLAMRQAGARTIGQDEASSVVYGMPRVAFEAGAVERQVPLDRVTATLGEFLSGLRKKAA